MIVHCKAPRTIFEVVRYSKTKPKRFDCIDERMIFDAAMKTKGLVFSCV